MRGFSVISFLKFFNYFFFFIAESGGEREITFCFFFTLYFNVCVCVNVDR